MNTNYLPAVNTYTFIFFNASLTLVIFGLVGNTMMFLVFSRHNLRRLSISTYFRAMAILNCFITLNWLKLFFDKQYNYNLSNQSQFLCKLLYYTIYSARPMSAWILVAAGIDRFLTIVYPTLFSFIRKPKFQLAVVCIISFYNAAYYVHLVFNENLSFNPNTNSTTCICWAIRYLYLSDLINTAVLPFAFMVVSSTAICVYVIKSRKRVRKYTLGSGIPSRRSRDIKFGFTLIVLNIYFFLSNAPNPLFNFLNFYIDINANVKQVLRVNFIGLYYSFYSLVFYAQLLANGLIRQEFFRLFNFLKKK